MFDLFSSDFKTILKGSFIFGSSVFGLRSSVFVLYPRVLRLDIFRLESCLIYFQDDFEGVFVLGSSVFVLYVYPPILKQPLSTHVPIWTPPQEN